MENAYVYGQKNSGSLQCCITCGTSIKELDKEAERRGIARQSLIKTWIVDRLDAAKLAQQAV
jgi:hypothetical protein